LDMPYHFDAGLICRQKRQVEKKRKAACRGRGFRDVLT